MGYHLEELLERDIAHIRDKVREMGDLAVRGIEDSMRALTDGDSRLAYACILRDSRIDDLESRIDSMIVEFMIRHIPVATQLRFAHSVAKIICELERVGDYAESICRQAIEISASPYTPDLSKFGNLGETAVEMMRSAIRAFLDEDVDLAIKTKQLDAKANVLHQDIYRELVAARPEGTQQLAMLFSLLSVANRFERVADQAGNICDEVSYIVTGENTRHRLSRDIRILFVSSSNSCRSLMAVAIANAIGGDHIEFLSAGVEADLPDVKAVEFLKTKNIDASAHTPTRLGSLDDVKQFKAVVALGREAASALPRLGYRTIALEWDVAQPGEGGPTYAEVFDDLVERITLLIRSLHGTTTSLAKGEA
ncbi:MAG: phosphate signaling complex protein PhoU [Candidatus Binatia bacterium]